MSERTLEELENLTESDYLQLVAFAEKRLSIIFNVRKVPEGKRGEDFVQEVITKTLEGTRNWNSGATPNFKNYLFSAVKSEINNFTNLKLRKSEIDVDSNSDYYFWSEILEDENFLVKKIQEEAINHVYDKLNEIDNSIGTLLLLELEDYSAEEIAEEMEIEVKDVYNLRKRLKRHGVKIWQEFTQQEALK